MPPPLSRSSEAQAPPPPSPSPLQLEGGKGECVGLAHCFGESEKRGRKRRGRWTQAMSGQVAVRVPVPFVALQIPPFNEVLDALLDHPGIGLEEGPQLPQHLRLQLGVVQLLPRLHGADDAGLHHVLPVIVRHALHTFAHGSDSDRNLELPLGTAEVLIDLEDISLRDRFGLHVPSLLQHRELPKGQRVQHRLHLVQGQPQLHRDDLHRNLLASIQQAQHAGLVGRHRNLLGAAPEPRRHRGRAQGVDPPQNPALCGLIVKLLEEVDVVLQLSREVHGLRLIRRPVPRGQHLHGEVQLQQDVFLLAIGNEVLLSLRALALVHNHALKLRGVRGTHLQLELGQELLFVVIVCLADQ
eukprot:RCo006542